MGQFALSCGRYGLASAQDAEKFRVASQFLLMEVIHIIDLREKYGNNYQKPRRREIPLFALFLPLQCGTSGTPVFSLSIAIIKSSGIDKQVNQEQPKTLEAHPWRTGIATEKCGFHLPDGARYDCLPRLPGMQDPAPL